jgi:hypothetical protein
LGRKPVAERPSSWNLRGVDLSRARPRDLRLIGVDLGCAWADVRLPEDAEHWLVEDWPAFCDRAEAAIRLLAEGDLKDVAEIWLDDERSIRGPAQSIGFVATWDLRHLGGDDLVDLVRRVVAPR